MSPTLATFLFEAANFLVLAIVLGWLLFNPVRTALANQQSRIEAAAKEAAEKLEQVKQERAEVESKRKQLQDELNTLRTRELDAARKKADEILADARTAAEREREMLRRRATQMADTEMAIVSRAIAGAAAQTVGQFLQQIEGPEIEMALVKFASEQLGQLPAAARTPARVTSARPLTAEGRAVIETALGDGDANATFNVDEQLGLGVKIATPSGLVDATAAGLAQFAQRSLSQQLVHYANNHATDAFVSDAGSLEGS